MSFLRTCLTLLTVLGTAHALPAWQDDEKRPLPSRRGDDGVPLQKLNLPSDVPVIVTPDLKKALDALGVGSVVLSAERYQELSKLAEQARQQVKSSGEVLFTTFRLSGDVKALVGREVAELVFELEFRTETPNAAVPLPLKGVRLSSATLNGSVPVWGPDPEKLSLLVKEPQQCKLRLTATVPLSRVGNERRIALERIPPAAVTTLDLSVPGNVTQAAISGVGTVLVTKVKDGHSQLKASALGILSELDLSWQVGEATPTAGVATMEGDLRITLEDTAAQIEVKLRPVPLQPLQLPWKVRLPDNAVQLRAELIRSEALGSEPLVMTRGTDGLYTISSPYPTPTLEFTHVALRWRQSLIEDDPKKKVTLGSCEVVEPAGRQQTGTLSVIAPESPVVMLRPVHLTPLERDVVSGDRDKRVSRYRYAQQPAGLQAIPLPASLTRGAVEYKLLHTLAFQDGAWLLSTELEVTRAVRAQLTSLEFAWPADWVVSRKVLFSPVVREMEQDTKAQRLRVVLDGKQPGSFTVRLESAPQGSPAGLSLAVPSLSGAQGLQGERPVPVELVPLQELVKLDSRSAQLKVDPMTVGLRDEEGPTGEVTQYRIAAHPATLVVSRIPRLPKYRGRVEVFLSKDLTQTRQFFDIQWNGPTPRRLNVLVPPGVRSVRFARVHSVSGKQETLPNSPLASREDGVGGWDTYAVELPIGAGAELQLVALVESATNNPLTVPIVRLSEGQAATEGSIEARVTHDLGTTLKVPEVPGWHVTAERPGGIELRGDSLDHLLALEVTPSTVSPATIAGQVRESQVSVRNTGAAVVAQYAWKLEALRTTELILEVHARAEEVNLLEWTLDDEAWPSDAWTWVKGEKTTQLKLTLPPSRLRQPFQLKATLQFAAPAFSHLIRLPAVLWTSPQGRITPGPRTWRVEADPGVWLITANQSVDETHHGQTSWLPTSPRASGAASSLVFRGSEYEASLMVLTAPRAAVILSLSILALAVVGFLASRPAGLRRAMYGLPILLILVHLLAPAPAAVLLWGMLPGLVIGLFLLGIQQWQRAGKNRRPLVFQSAAASTSSHAQPSVSSSRSVVIAQAPTLVPEPRSAVR
jgi:hypothetical protein